MSYTTKTGHGKDQAGCGKFGCGRGGKYMCGASHSSVSDNDDIKAPAKTISKVEEHEEIDTSNSNILNLSRDHGYLDSEQMTDFELDYFSVFLELDNNAWFDINPTVKIIDGKKVDCFDYMSFGECVATGIPDPDETDFNSEIYINKDNFDKAFQKFVDSGSYSFWSNSLGCDEGLVKGLNSKQMAVFIEDAVGCSSDMEDSLHMLIKDREKFKKAIDQVPFKARINLYNTLFENLDKYDDAGDDAIDIVDESIANHNNPLELTTVAAVDSKFYENFKDRLNFTRGDLLSINPKSVSFIDFKDLDDLETVKHLADPVEYVERYKKMVDKNPAGSVFEFFDKND